LIGHGSFGAVYEIRRTIGKTIEKSALKVMTIPKESSEITELSRKGYDDESITERFNGMKESIEDEYAMMAKLKGCANVVYCDDIKSIQHNNKMGWDIYIRMELLTPLLSYHNGIMDEREIIRLGKEMCNALVMCQRNDIVHRDIKPQNMFVSNDGTFKLGDFGVAKAVEHTMSGTMTGTYDYMAPEVELHRPYNRTVDIYSLGMVLYWYLNEKRLPFLPLPPVTIKWKDEEKAKERRLQGEAVPDPARGSEELKRIVLKACAFDPENRYQTAAEMLKDLNTLPTATDKPEKDKPFSEHVSVDHPPQESNADTPISGNGTGTVSVWKNKERERKRISSANQEDTAEEETVGVFNHLITGNQNSSEDDDSSDDDDSSRKPKIKIGLILGALCLVATVVMIGFLIRAIHSRDQSIALANPTTAISEDVIYPEDAQVIYDFICSGGHLPLSSGNDHLGTLNTPVTNCTGLMLQMTITEYTGSPFGEWNLEVQRQDGTWEAAGTFEITDSLVLGETLEYEFSFDGPKDIYGVGFSAAFDSHFILGLMKNISM